MGSNIHTRTDAIPPAATVRIAGGRPLTVADTPLPPIRTAGEYDLTHVLGRGGMGVVYLARHRGLKRKVAYKVLTLFGNLDPAALDRFRGEAQTLAKLHHPNIVQVFDAGTEDGRPFLAMEYVPGGSLADTVKGVRLSPREAAEMVGTLAAAVGHAHAHGIIHRDLKPGNILLTEDRRPKVADFGLARDLASEHLTCSGMIAGTPTYMAPEQLRGDKDLTPAADVWALGVLLYELLAGTVPFAGGDPQQILTNILHHEAVSLRAWQPHLSRDLETVCQKCLEKEPHRRYATGAELAADLDRFLTGQPILARPVGPVEKGVRWCRRNPAVAGLLAAVAVILTAATGLSVTLWRQAEVERGNAEREAARATTIAAAQVKMREDADAAAAAEKRSREAAEQAAAAERTARIEAEEMTAQLDAFLASYRPGVYQDPQSRFLQHLDATAAELQKDGGNPTIRARLLLSLGITYRATGAFEKGLRLIELSHALRSRHLPPADPVIYETARELAYTYVHVRRGADAVRLLEPLVTAKVAALPPDAVEAVRELSLLKIAYQSARQVQEEGAVGERIVAICRKHYGDDHHRTLWHTLELPRHQLESRNFAETIPLIERAVGVYRRAFGEESEEVMAARGLLGRFYLEAGRPHDALPYLEEVYARIVRAIGELHPNASFDRHALARAYEATGQYAKAVPLRWVMLAEGHATRDPWVLAAATRHLARDLMWSRK
jgi:tetratricopeptide (TPR) repeat protein/predicted Ser/Thr protein kinase